MKKILLLSVIGLMTSMTMIGQTYTSLWKQVSEAEDKDLPQTAIEVLQQIVQKAEAEKAYGQLLKAELKEAKVKTEVSPDSLEPAVSRLVVREQQAQDEVLKAVYNTVLGYIYLHNHSLDTDNYQSIAQAYYDKAMAHPEMLAAVKTTAYEPVMTTGRDSKYFDDDMLSVIGYETGCFATLRDYYLKTGNRHAALLTSLEVLKQEQPTDHVPLNKSVYLQRLDSLIDVYADLPECGEVAIARYDYMKRFTDATAEQKWQYINQALDRWGSWQRMNYLRNSQRVLTSLHFSASLENKVCIPDQRQEVKLSGLRGVNQLTMKVYQAKVDGDTELNPSWQDDYKELKPLLKAMPERTLTKNYVGKKSYEEFDDSMWLEGLPVGVYMLEFETLPATDVRRELLFVSDVRVLSLAQADKVIRYVVVNATTGQPIKGANIRLSFGYSKKSTTKVTTDANGEYLFTYDKERPREIWGYTSNDKACPEYDGSGSFSYYERDWTTNRTAIFTDRSIYRPGQTVHMAAVCSYSNDGLNNEVDKGKKINVVLRDANHQTIEEKDLTTDEFGTATADFRLPSNGLNGRYSLSVEGTTQYFRVEEYKRPTFEVEFPEVNQRYEDGDTVVVSAKARSYAGVPVQGARVKYKVERKQAYWWISYSRYWNMGVIGTGSDNEEIASGNAITADDGSFTVEIPMIVPKTRYPMFYNFVVTADVTDQAGETHHGEMSLPLGNRKTAFSCSLPDKFLAEEAPAVTFNLRNAAGMDIPASLRYRIDNGKWQEGQTNTQLTIFNDQMKSGNHTLEAICEGDSLKQEFVVFSLDDKTPATTTEDWFYISDYQFPDDGKPVTLQVGSSDKNVHIVYAIMSGKTIIESGRVDKSNELINRKLTYKEEYGNGLLLNFAWVKNGKAYTHEVTITRPIPDMRLRMKWQTFRNRLTPGQEEEWTLVITNPDGTPANAQLIATLYDKSLDQLADHGWSLNPYIWLPNPSTSWYSATWGNISCSGSKYHGSLSYSDLRFTQFNHSLYPNEYYYSTRVYESHSRRYKNANVLMAAAGKEPVEDEVVMMEDKAVVEEAPAMESEEEAADSGVTDQARQNLNETAFFYPQLIADSTGVVTMKFTLPECLTTWRFMGVAHTKNMMCGSLTDEAVASKDVMIQPNMPRFLRVGDKATVSARIFNTGDKTVTGSARLQLIDPETEKVVAQSAQQVTLAPDTTVSVTFVCQPREDWNTLLIAKVMITGKDFSDGEQHYLPILPNRERVTITVPFTQNEPDTKIINLTEIFPANNQKLTANGSKLTIEYTNNPVWLMIQALPVVGEPCSDNAISQAASFYANAIGRHILAQNPNAKNVFESWNREEGNETSMMSNLQKDQELKDLVLNETPWVLDANREVEQKQRLADFFDQNTMNVRLSSAIDKLKKLQLSDGSWTWWKGMKGSFYITVEISEMLVRLNQMVGDQKETQDMLKASFKYIGKEIVELVDEMKKEEKKGYKQYFPSHKALQWLYICAIDGRELPSKVEDANNYLKNLLKKETKNQTIYEKAMSAIVLNNKTYIKSLKEYTVYKEEMGRYYDTRRAGYSWRDYRIPTQVAAIEAIKRMTPEDTQTIMEMQRWLLQEKRTQAWDTPINSVDAVYAFLNGNAEQLKAQEKTVLKVDEQTIVTSTATAGIGYVKTAISGEGKKTFTAEKTSTGTSWGAVYAQFMQQTSDIKDQQSGISVKRELLLNAQSNQNTLKVGDRIKIRLTIQADRDYDFVQVIDRRAACLEPINQLSGYHWGYYCSPKDYTTNYYFDGLAKGKHVIETEYYVDRAGVYETGTCTVECAYSPEFRGLTKSQTITVE